MEEYSYDGGESDCTFPESGVDLRNKRDLIRWKWLPGGQRLPRYEAKIPHVEETEVQPTDASSAEVEALLELAKRMSADAKQLQQEYIYTKQRAAVLKEEKDLLAWHIAANSKVIKLRQKEAEFSNTNTGSLEKKLLSLRDDTDRLERERTSLQHEYGKLLQKVEGLEEEYTNVAEEMQDWLSRRGDFLADTTHERRLAGQERRLRNRQLAKLNRACNTDKKWHTKIDAVRNADNMILDAFEDVSNNLVEAFDQVEDVTSPIREKILAREPTDPLLGFVPGTVHTE